MRQRTYQINAAPAAVMALAAALVMFLPSVGLASGGAGPRVGWAAYPAGSAGFLRACSFRHPLCVLAAPSTQATYFAAALNAADEAWDAVVDSMGAPAPEGALGAPWSVYLVDGLESGSDAFFDARDPVSRYDRGASFAVVDRSTPAGCSLAFSLSRATARGSMWRAAPATDEGSARAESEAIALLANPCAVATDVSLEAFQEQPERCIVDATSLTFERGASLFFEWLDERFSAARAAPGALIVGLWALSPTLTPPGALNWDGTPNGFDVLRSSLRDALSNGSTFDDVLVRFALARALRHPPPRAGWHLSWPDRPRRIASPRPIAPTGTSYVIVDCAGSAKGARLRLEAEWEDYCRMRWVAVKLDAAGNILGEIAIPSLALGTRTSMTLGELDGTARVMVIAQNVGSTEHVFEPNQTEWEAHGWLLTVAAQ